MSLLKHGVSSAIYEVRPQGYESGGNIALAPNAARVLDHVGVYGRLRNQGFNYEEIAFENGAGEVLGTFLNGSQKEYNFHALRIHRAILHDELLAACKQRGIPIYFDRKFKRIVSETDASVTVEFEGGNTVAADFVVGCDGIHSKVRSHIKEVTPEFSGLMGIMGMVMRPDLDSLHQAVKTRPAMMFGDTGSFAIMPSSFDGEEIGYFATIEVEDCSRQGWASLYQDKEALRKMLADRFLFSGSKWPRLVQELCQKTPVETLTSWPLVSFPLVFCSLSLLTKSRFFSVPELGSWKTSTGRVIVVGDAAHAIPPTGGQGAAMAFEDAETLAYTLQRIYDSDLSAPTEVQGHGHLIGDQLGKWQRHRQQRIAKVIDFTTKNGALRKSSPQFYEQAAKEWILWIVFKFMGPQAGAQWLYSYNGENVLSALV